MEPTLTQRSCLECNEPTGYLHRASCSKRGAVKLADTDLPLDTADIDADNAVVLPEGWTVTRSDKLPFKSITVKSPDGKVALLSNMGRNPENVFYEFVDALLAGRDKLS